MVLHGERVAEQLQRGVLTCHCGLTVGVSLVNFAVLLRVCEVL